MPNPKASIKYSEFDPSLVKFGPVGRYSKGGKFVPLYGPSKQRIVIQTAILSWPFGVSIYENPRTGEKTYSIDVAFRDLQTDPKIKTFYDKMLELNEVVLSEAADPSCSWFGKPMSKEVLNEIYRPLVKQPKDPRYSPTMKIKIPVAKGVPTPEFYNEAKELVSLDSITKGCTIVCILELRPVWFVNKTFGVTWQLVQACITGRASAGGPQKFNGYAFLDEN